LYPPPRYDCIIEPFAGSARYSLKYPENDVTLLEIDPVIYGIWYWLIHEATRSDIELLPQLKRGDDLRKMTQLSSVEKDLLGFAVGFGRSSPGNVVTPRADATGWPKEDSRWRPNNAVDLLKTNILKALDKVRHWKVFCKSYCQYKINRESVWFIDPPYQYSAGRCYTYNQIDYRKLASYCKTRNGQTIVCEGNGADWLPFVELKTSHSGSWRTLKEKVWVSV